MNKEIIEVKDVRLSFGKHRALAGIDIRFNQGETVLLAGKNGAGKSTLLRCLAGLIFPDAGHIYRPGIAKHQIGFISDRMSLFEDMTLERAIDFHSRVFQVKEFNRSLMDELNLAPTQKIKDLSAGERAIFHLSLLLSQKPQLLLLDEIIHTMDPYIRELFLNGLIDLIAECGTTVIMVNQTFSDTGRIPERVLIMEDGRFIFDEKSEDLPKKIKKVVTAAGESLKGDIPVLYVNRSSLYREYIVYPYAEEAAKKSGYDFQEVTLTEIIKSFIGGYYAKKRTT